MIVISSLCEQLSKCLYSYWINLYLALSKRNHIVLRMISSKVIITRQKSIANHYSFEDEIGLSTYDLHLISIAKTINNSNLSMNEASKTTYLI